MQIAAEIDIIDDRPPGVDANIYRTHVAVASVSPEGHFNVTFFDRARLATGEQVGLGDTPVIWSDQARRFLVPAHKRGHVLYEDLCKGRATRPSGEQIEPSPKHWKLWEKLCKLRSSGRAPGLGVLEKVAEEIGGLYHPEVQRRRKAAGKGGIFALGPKELRKLLGFDDDDLDDLDDDDDDDLDDLDA